MKFRPCIDLHQGKVKQIVGGSLTEKTKSHLSRATENFVSSHNAAYYANLYREYNLTGGHIIKLGPENDRQAESALKAWPGGMQIGGGITESNAEKWLNAGASHVIVTSCLFTRGQLDLKKVESLSRIAGKANLVLDLSCRRKGSDWVVVTDRWQTYTDFVLTGDSLKELSNYCDEFLIHGVDVEGKRCGIEVSLVELLSQHHSCPITYAGGIASMEDISLINELGKGRIDFTVGSALDLFGGNISFTSLVK
jgi:phosphoribosylformimino-5-aminoimidazole carboxamide ribotide isomerase